MTTTSCKWELMLVENRFYVHTRPFGQKIREKAHNEIFDYFNFFQQKKRWPELSILYASVDENCSKASNASAAYMRDGPPPI